MESAPSAEFNFYHDPEAAYIVLNSLKCPITILPLESDEGITIPIVNSIILTITFLTLLNVDKIT